MYGAPCRRSRATHYDSTHYVWRTMPSEPGYPLRLYSLRLYSLWLYRVRTMPSEPGYSLRLYPHYDSTHYVWRTMPSEPGYPLRLYLLGLYSLCMAHHAVGAGLPTTTLLTRTLLTMYGAPCRRSRASSRHGDYLLTTYYLLPTKSHHAVGAGRRLLVEDADGALHTRQVDRVTHLGEG